MPFVIRIILQRGIALTYSFLAFLGIAPDATIPTEEQAIQYAEERTEIVQAILSDPALNPITNDYDFENVVRDAEESLIHREGVGTTTSSKESPTTEIPEINIPRPTPPSPKEIFVPEIAEEPEPEVVAQTKASDIDDALVNIICLQREGNMISANTGSGVVISPRGLVITNAHVAMPFLLEAYRGEDFMDCSLYRENIPTYGYKARLIYIPPEWISENANVISSPNPRGTGENDYAILYITKNTNPALSLPRRFDFFSVNTDSDYIEEGDQVTVAGYPGAPTSILDLTHSVSLKTDQVEVDDVFTFSNNQIDVFSTDVTHVAARGASGGGVFKNNELVGLTVTTSGSDGNAQINALTLDYINRDLISDYGSGINTISNSNFEELADDFEDDFIEDLAKMLLKYL